MNTRILSFLFIAFFLAACEDKNDLEKTEESEVSATQKWIESTMRTHYYWYNEIPAPDKLDYTLDDEFFFYSIDRKSTRLNSSH